MLLICCSGWVGGPSGACTQNKLLAKGVKWRDTIENDLHDNIRVFINVLCLYRKQKVLDGVAVYVATVYINERIKKSTEKEFLSTDCFTSVLFACFT